MLFLFWSALVNLGSYRSLNRLHFAYIQLANVFVLILDEGLHSVMRKNLQVVTNCIRLVLTSNLSPAVPNPSLLAIVNGLLTTCYKVEGC